jgi:hypothetical protein
MTTRELKPKECDNPACGKLFMPWRSTQVACSLPCGMIIAADKEKRKKLRAIRLERSEWYAKNMTLNAAYAKAQPAVNEFVRLRDASFGCISCETGRVQDAGHLFPIGQKYRCNPIRINPFLIHGQCRQCNGYEGGNVHGYLAGLKNRYSQKYIDQCYAIKAAADRGEIPPFTKDELVVKAAEYRKLSRELKRAAA